MIKKQEEEESEEEDPLDAFMANIENEVKKQDKKDSVQKRDTIKGVRDDLETMDDEESYYKYIEENPDAGKMFLDADDPVEYDEDGNPIPGTQKDRKMIDPLPMIYHSEIEYKTFEKNFYVEHDNIKRLTDSEVSMLRGKLGIQVSGFFPPKPVTSFAHFGFDEKLMKVIRKMEYTSPTPIQAQGTPSALSGRDVIGIAKTGSGKTAAFVWPMLSHVLDQPVLEEGDGPIALIVAPTRELCQQIHAEVKRFGKIYGVRSTACYGGGSMWEQQKSLAEGSEIVVATPGRIIDHVQKNYTNMRRVTYLVFDEADRMFEMGFEYQVRSIANNIRPDRQTLLFSATFKRRIEKLARDILCDPVRIVQGDVGEANQDVLQIVEVLPNLDAKWHWLTRKIVQLTSQGSLLIFVTKKVNAEDISNKMKQKGYDVCLLHGDMNQFDRNKVIGEFKKQQVSTMVATDVAARGLDIPSIKNVINYDVARDIDTHTHRIGRTGRAGEKGTAYTLITSTDVYFAGDLVRNLEGANQRVPEALMNLAVQNARFRKSRYKHGKGKGFVAKERPGLGSTAPIKRHSSNSSAPTMTTAAFRQASRGRGGVMGGRAASMKDYFQNQYKSNFIKSSEPETSWKAGGFKAPLETSSSSGQKRKKKSRWDS
uniref:ATP-dependent RNA helicase DDX42-like isoform X1 n=1 Tax=Styela clava TaxID=7725 RepID=UPI00193A906A|nr:ATP-dependent RNA helicase DDX42-like isoform X1 [Styela clava]XP_039248090.1 ATP-dependent RNA helicase DDX42-like isoform X2 [Styela clava]